MQGLSPLKTAVFLGERTASSHRPSMDHNPVQTLSIVAEARRGCCFDESFFTIKGASSYAASLGNCLLVVRKLYYLLVLRTPHCRPLACHRHLPMWVSAPLRFPHLVHKAIDSSESCFLNMGVSSPVRDSWYLGFVPWPCDDNNRCAVSYCPLWS